MPVEPCPPAQESRLLETAPLIRSTLSQAPGYGLSLATTAMGPASLQQWCVWVEPGVGDPPDRWQKRWLTAVTAALDTWSNHLPVVRVNTPEQAHVRLLRQRPQAKNGQWLARQQRSQSTAAHEGSASGRVAI